MSVDSKRREVARLKNEIADLQKKDSIDAGRDASKAKEVATTARSLSSTRSESTANSHKNKIIRLESDRAKLSSKRSDTAKKIAQKTATLHRAEQHLSKAEEVERKKATAIQKKIEKEQLSHQRQITHELKTQKMLMNSPKYNQSKGGNHVQYDVFISHASEDKDSLVRPLAEELDRLGFKVWYDESTLKVGDSLRQKIDQGLSSSRYGIVVLSQSFFAKKWPQYELDGLVEKEMRVGKTILPIWHHVSKDEVFFFSPALANKVALNTSIDSVSDIAKQLADVLTKDE